MILAALLCGLSLFAADRKKQTQLQSLCGSNALQGSAVSISVRKIDGSPIAEINGNTRLIPASNVKLLTTAAALSALGGEFCFDTGLGYSGELRDSVLYGNLLIINGLDPTLCGEDCDTSCFKDWKSLIKAGGIKTIKGDIYAEGGILEESKSSCGIHHPSWQLEDVNSGDAPDLETGLCASLFRSHLIRSGFDVEGEILPFSRDSLNLLFIHRSAPLKELVRHCNVVSDNGYAEAFLKALGWKDSQNTSFESSNKARQKIMQQILTCSPGRYLLVDGSGLSRKNLVSACYFTDFLTAMAASEEFGNFLASLPSPGEGTLKNILRNAGPGLRARLKMKSGSMDGVRCYSGYLLDSKGKPETVFSILTNSSTASQNEVTAVIEKMLTVIGE